MSGSESESEEESEESGRLFSFVNQLLDQAIELVGDDELGEAPDLLSEQERVLDQEFVTPNRKDIIKEAVEVIFRSEQQRIAEEEGIAEEDAHKIKGVELDIKRPEEVVVDFGLALEILHDYIVHRVEERNGSEKINPIVEVDPPTMTQVVGEPKIGKSGNITILHGARNIIYNICDELDFNKHERELVQIAHRIAARRNGLHRFVLVDDVVIIDTEFSKTLAHGGRSVGQSTSPNQMVRGD